MATSTVATSMANSLSIAMVLATMGKMVSADSPPLVQPTNATLPVSESQSMTQLRLTGGPLFKQQAPYNLAPLTPQAGKGQTSVAVSQNTFAGTVKTADPQTTMNLTSSDIAFISCDPNDSNISASQVVLNAGQAKPKAIILYSEIANSCSLDAPTTYTTIYTMTSVNDAQNIVGTTGLYPVTSDDLMARIGTNATSGNPGNGSSASTDNGPAPTTAVAMSILYSITGIITLLFLIIIATGAVRAHRHPERYGPRNGYSGRPRQSRAKGLARAMLETLPIVKFGDPESTKPGSTEVELEEGSSSVKPPPTGSGPQKMETISEEPATEQPPKTLAEMSSADATLDVGKGKEEVPKSSDAEVAPPKEGELGCSICTEDFTTGEDVRVLPCQHKYHPACIDPWLLNVSGTCPLCRHDLRPDAAESSKGTAATTDELPPPLDAEPATEAAGQEATEDAASTHQGNVMSRFLDLNRLRHAPPDERIAALRRLREESRSAGEPDVGDAEAQRSGRARLTTRLRDKFRIRTRTEDAVTPE